jgi:mannosyltransferase OCH1-like enzyme
MKSDLIRITIVKHFGGVYLDYSIMLTESLDWLLNPK